MLKKEILDSLFPLECLGCGQEDVWLCEKCFRLLPFQRKQLCLFCGQENDDGRTCDDCQPKHFLDGALIAGDYEDKVLSELIKKLKYSFIKDLGIVLGGFACLFLKNFRQIENQSPLPFKTSFLAPIPLSRRRENWRGFNQAELIAGPISKEFGSPVSRGLSRPKHNRPQAKLKEKDRSANIKDCFIWNDGKPINKNIILIDDVATTGATLDEAARVLKEAGAKKVWGLAIAKG